MRSFFKVGRFMARQKSSTASSILSLILGLNVTPKKWLGLVSMTVLTVAGFVTNCSRAVPENVSLSIEIPSTFNGSLTVNPILEMAIVNLRMNPTSPAKAYFFENPAGGGNLGAVGGNLGPGAKFSISITDNIPVSPNMMVQLLLVFKDGGTNAMRFAYGSAFVDSTKSGELAANVQTQWHGSSTKEGRVAGRYVTSYSSTPSPTYSGPTGTLYTEFNPKISNNPPMIIQTGEIVNGWFSIMILDGTQLTDNTGVDFKYRIQKDDGSSELLFANAPGVTSGTEPMNLSHPFFNEFAGAYGTYNNVRKIAKVNVPSSFRDESHGEGQPQLHGQGATEFIAGWFIANSANTDLATYLSTKVACNPGAVKETIPNLYADPNGVLPIAYTNVLDSYDDTPDVGKDYTTYANPAFGTILSSLQAAPSNKTACLAPSALFVTAMNVFHRGIGEGRDSVFGMQPPFAMQDVTQARNSYMKIVVNHDFTNYTPTLDLKLKLLEGTWGADSVQGISIFMRKHNFGGYGSDGEDENGLCNERAIQQGFQFKTDYTTPNPDAEGIVQVGITSPPGYGSFSYSNSSGESIYNWEYIACPFRTVNAVKRYFKEGIREGCIEGCNQDQFYGFGRKISVGNDKDDYTVSTPTDVYTLGQVASRVMGVVNTVSGGFTDITVNSNLYNITNIGDELVAIKMGESSGGCGNGMSQPFESIIVKDKPAADTLRINRGTFIDNLPTDSGRLTANFSTTPFCYVQVVRVKEYGNLTINGTGSLYPPPFDSPTNAGGGVVFIRVSGTLDISATSATNVITADQLGYLIKTNYNGLSTSNSSNTFTQAGAGGSHFGQGGQGGAATGFAIIPAQPAMNGGFFGGPLQAQFTFGGGGHSSGPGPTNIGGTGGGIIYIAAKKINIGANNKIISANGQMGYGGNAAPAGGGGAGGSVTVITKTIDRTGSNTLTAEALGGDSPSSTVEIRAGSGGGGYARIYTCNPTAAGATVAGGAIPDNNFDDSEGAGLSATVGMPGSSNITMPSFCP